MPIVRFNYTDTKLPITNKRGLKYFIPTIFHQENSLYDSIDFIICSDKTILQINNDYLDHDYYTDIITFQLNEKDCPIIGEIYISVDRIKENATIHNEPLEKEILRVMFHGCLHLCGYKDKTKTEIKKMREKEEFYIAQYYTQ